MLAFGSNLKSLRIARKLSQADLAVRCFMRVDQVSAYERGIREPGILDLKVLEDRLGTTLGEITDGLPAPVRHTGTKLVLDQVAREPGILMQEIAASLDLPEWYVCQIILCLKSIGAVTQRRRGWHQRDLSGLTQREREVFTYLARQASNAEIALELGIGVETVRTYVAQVLRKLELQSRKDVLGILPGLKE